MSQLAVPMYSQTPFRLGLPSGIRPPPFVVALAPAFAGAAGAWALPGVSVSERQTTAAAAVDKRVRDLDIEIIFIGARCAGFQSYIPRDLVSIRREFG